MDMKSLSSDRRSFLKTTGTVLLGSAVSPQLVFALGAGSSRKSVLKVGLIGCGGRGTGAAIQALKADPDVVITAMGDIFEDRLEASYEALMKVAPDKVKVNKRH